MNIHFIAIGGSAMHQLALALHKNGYKVSGSDDEIYEPASRMVIPIKRIPELSKEKIHKGFGKNGLSVLNSKDDQEQWLQQQLYENACLLLMSSGNFNGADILTFAKKKISSSNSETILKGTIHQ